MQNITYNIFGNKIHVIKSTIRILAPDMQHGHLHNIRNIFIAITSQIWNFLGTHNLVQNSIQQPQKIIEMHIFICSHMHINKYLI